MHIWVHVGTSLADNLCKMFGTVWVQAVCHSDSVPETIKKSYFKKKLASDNESMKNLPNMQI